MVRAQNTSPDIQIRLATLEDVNELTDNACKLMFESEGETVDKAIIRAAITRYLTNPPKGNYYMVAYDNSDSAKKTMGTAMITHEMNVEQGGLVCWIHNAYVSGDARRLGVFSNKLYAHIKQISDADPLVKAICLFAEHSNNSAHKRTKN